MINKKNLWFLTLFSLVLVLSIYYVTMPNELLVSKNNEVKSPENTVVDIQETDALSALKVEDNNQSLQEMNELKEKLTDSKSTIEEKNTAFEALKELNTRSAKEETLESKIKSAYNLESFVKVDGDQIRVVVGGTDQGKEIANNIMRTVQEEFTDKVYISVKFQS